MKNYDGLFDNEEKVVEHSNDIINTPDFNDNPLSGEYKKLAREYSKLKKQTLKLIRLSDQQQRSLNDAKDELTKLNEISQQISRSLEFDNVFNSIMNYLINTYGFQGFSLAVLADDKKSFIIEKVVFPEKYRHFDDIYSKINIRLDNRQNVISKSIIQNRIIYFEKVDVNLIKEEIVKEMVLKSNMKSILVMPTIVDKQVIGAFTLTAHDNNVVLREEDISAISRFVNQISIILKNSRLYDQLEQERALLEQRVKERTHDLEQALKLVNEKRAVISKQFTDSIEIIYSLIAKTSSRLYERTKEITEICIDFAGFLGFDKQSKEDLRIASMLHDLGMIGVREKLSSEHKNLSDDEKEFIQSHPEKSVEIIRTLENTSEIKKIILQHHEKYDGTGFPSGLKGEEISLGARVLSVVSYFVDISKMRKYQNINRENDIISELIYQKGRMLDPAITDKFIELIDKSHLIYKVNEDDITFSSSGRQFTWIIPSNVHFETIIVGRIMEKVNLYNPDSDSAFIIDYGLCELVRNAIVHGNKYNEDKEVTIKFNSEQINGKIKLIFSIIDEGVGMDINSHSVFTNARKQILNILNSINKFSEDNNLKDNAEFNNIQRNVRDILSDYYTDYHTFRQLDIPEATGGVGLLHVKKTFDSVEFKNIIINNEITGTEVIVSKIIDIN